ncbi:hypothetical protein ACP70R_043697 [Stipagrostis hirtigluma subsp. patula]
MPGAMGLKTYTRKRKRTIVQQQTTPELLDEIVFEILIRLPVQSLSRFRSVCKAWHAIISDPAFIRAHLQCSKQKQHQESSSFLITPRLQKEFEDTPAGVSSTHICFYQWCLQQDKRRIATLVCGKVFPGEVLGRVSQIAHCDGLVLIPTSTNAYVFNPATRDAVVLPESQRDVMRHHSCLPIGFGLDTSTGRYKVARAFYRSSANPRSSFVMPPRKQLFVSRFAIRKGRRGASWNSWIRAWWGSHDHDSKEILAMGMEVFTINGEDGSWRETLVDPPYPVLSSQTAVHCKGYLFYFINKNNQQQPPRGLLRFSLQDETFGITKFPELYPSFEDEDIHVSELDGELCFTYLAKHMQHVLIFVTRDVLVPKWDIRHIVSIPEQCYPIASLGSMSSLGSNGILLRQGTCIFRYDLEARKVRKDEIFDMDGFIYVGSSLPTRRKVFWFDLISYTESLVPITPKGISQA